MFEFICPQCGGQWVDEDGIEPICPNCQHDKPILKKNPEE